MNIGELLFNTAKKAKPVSDMKYRPQLDEGMAEQLGEVLHRPGIDQAARRMVGEAMDGGGHRPRFFEAPPEMTDQTMTMGGTEGDQFAAQPQQDPRAAAMFQQQTIGNTDPAAMMMLGQSPEGAGPSTLPGGAMSGGDLPIDQIQQYLANNPEGTGSQGEVDMYSRRREMSPLEAARNRYETTPPAPRERSVMNRIGSGLWNAFRMWGENGGQGGLAGLAGAAATGAGAFGLKPEMHQRFKSQQYKDRALGEYQQEMEKEKARQGVTQEGLKSQQALYDLAKPEIDMLAGKGYLDDADLNHISQKYGIDLRDPNNPRFVEIDGPGGKRLIRLQNEAEYGVNTSVGIDPLKQEHDVEVPGSPGKYVPALPKDVLGTAVGVAQANAGRTERAETREERAAERAQDQAAKTRGAIGEADAQIAKASSELTDLSVARQRDIDQGLDVSDYDRRIAALKGEIAAAQTRKRNAEKEASKPQGGAAQRRAGGTFSEAEARRYYQNRGMSPEAVESAVAKAKQNGVIK